MNSRQTSLWGDAEIEKTISIMDPERKYRYQKMAQTLFDHRSKIIDPHIINIEVATQVRLMLRDGIEPNMLDDEEKAIFINTYGIDALTADIEVCGLDSQSARSPSNNTARNTAPNAYPPALINQKSIHRAAKKKHHRIQNDLTKRKF
jgi:hypothetical protein